MGILHCIHSLLWQQQVGGEPLANMHTPLGNPLEIQGILQSGKSTQSPRQGSSTGKASTAKTSSNYYYCKT